MTMKRKFDKLGRIVIPKEMRTQLGINNGEPVHIEVKGNKIILTNPVDPFGQYLSNLYETADEQSKELIRGIYTKYTDLK